MPPRPGASASWCSSTAGVRSARAIGSRRIRSVIVAINILIAVVSDFESAVRAWNTTWVSSEGVTLMGGWHNVFNGVAGILNILCMTGWWGIYVSKKRDDMLWPDMTWVFIIAYDLWNFCYTYNCLPTHAWYCGLALLLAPTVANFFWNKGGWIQNRANTLALWCMFAQVFPMFQDYSVFSTNSVNDPTVNLVVSALALAANVAALAYIIYRAKKLGVNPYKQEVFRGTRDFEKAMARADLTVEEKAWRSGTDSLQRRLARADNPAEPTTPQSQHRAHA